MALGLNTGDYDKKFSFSYDKPRAQTVDTEQNEYQKKFGTMDVFSAAASGGGYVQQFNGIPDKLTGEEIYEETLIAQKSDKCFCVNKCNNSLIFTKVFQKNADKHEVSNVLCRQGKGSDEN